MSHRRAFHIVIGVLLAASAVGLSVSVYLSGFSDADKQAENITKVILAVSSGIGALYMAVDRQIFDREQLILKGMLDRLSASIQGAEGVRNAVLVDSAKALITEELAPRIKRIEAAAANVMTYTQLAHEEDFRRRERRDNALLSLSKGIHRTTRAFRVLTKFRMAEGVPSEALVNTLAQALAAREAFLAAREELTILHASHEDHAEGLRVYSGLLINIIIDVRRSDPTAAADANAYEAVMLKHEQDLEELDERISKVLAVFLAPKRRRPRMPEGQSAANGAEEAAHGLPAEI